MIPVVIFTTISAIFFMVLFGITNNQLEQERSKLREEKKKSEKLSKLLDRAQYELNRRNEEFKYRPTFGFGPRIISNPYIPANEVYVINEAALSSAVNKRMMEEMDKLFMKSIMGGNNNERI